MTLDEAEVIFDSRFTNGWTVEAYLSPAEKVINKPILPTTDRTTNRMGHVRNWPGPDTPLVEAEFYDYAGNNHTGVFTSIEDAVNWLNKQDPKTGRVAVW